MLNMPVRSVFSEITDFLATNPTPQEIIAYQLSEDLQARAHELLERNGEDQLTPEERDEMFDFVRVDEMMSLLKVKMKLKLRNASACLYRKQCGSLSGIVPGIVVNIVACPPLLAPFLFMSIILTL